MNVENLLEKLREVSKDNPSKRGELFERFIKRYLQLDSYYGDIFEDIWLWNEWPNRDGIDTGVDLIARVRDTGALWAIQAKFYDDSKVGHSEVSKFVAASPTNIFEKRLLISTGNLTSVAEKTISKNDVNLLTLSDIIDTNIDWSSFNWEKPEDITYQQKELRPYQEAAIEAVTTGFNRISRGKLIMPPGSGKTFVALNIAEKMVGKGGNVLFLAPSIALVEQTLRAWLEDSHIPIRPFAITSDTTVGKEDKDLIRTSVLFMPPTTDAEELYEFASKPASEYMTVIVATYHSIDVVGKAQKLGLPKFDLIISDEAHRTTGVLKNEDDASHFLKVHSDKNVLGEKRLYMTATPRIFVPKLKGKVEDLGFEPYSMDDEEIYGEEFFRYGFGQAVDDGHLSDYRVIVFTVDEADVQSKLFTYLNEDDALEIEEATKLVGVWSALSGRVKGENLPPLERSVVFAGRIARSKQFAEQFEAAARAYYESTGQVGTFREFKVKHVDGSTPATDRKAMLDWLRGESIGSETRILSNAQVLTEGIDVPALDSVVFLDPRRSVVDIVQAVGRAMRKAPGKRYGYVILPIVVDPEEDTVKQIETSDRFRTVWEILAALRSIDDRFDARVREISIQRKQRKESSHGDSGYGDREDDMISIVSEQTSLPLDEEIRDAILGKIVERVGDRAYLETWARDVASATTRIERHVKEALKHDSKFGENARKEFNNFRRSLQHVINPSITEEEARSMLVQHIVTQPIFDALFDEYEFLKNNPVAISFEQISRVFETFVKRETQSLDGLYRLIKVRAKGLDKEEERQDFLRQLYDSFFQIAFPKTAESLGIVYTPVELVDFLIHSTDKILKNEFDLGLSSEDVVVLEPFSGTGTFLNRLIQMLPKENLERKYQANEIWGNEILLLPYYVALANIESAYYEKVGEHKPFDNMLLVDSFQMAEDNSESQMTMFPEQYTKMVNRQKEAKVNVIISNPPWFAWQSSENLANQAVSYETLENRIRETYSLDSTAQNKNSLYDAYIRAIRFASDRIESKGIISFVTNSGFLDGNAADGLRKHLAQDFAKIYILNLRGNARLSGEARRKEGDGIFAQGSRAGVALIILIKDDSIDKPADIYYHDIGDYLTREDKLSKLNEFKEITNVPWVKIKPNKKYDWINQRDDEFDNFPVIGTKDRNVKYKMFNEHSSGVKSNRDAWVFDFSKNEVNNNVIKMIDEFNSHVSLVQKGEINSSNVNQKINNNPKDISWTSSLKRLLLRGEKLNNNQSGTLVQSMYRPFIKQWFYYSRSLNERVYLMPKLIPEPMIENKILTVQGASGINPFSTLLVNSIPELGVLGVTQSFPLYTYELLDGEEGMFKTVGKEEIVTALSGNKYIRRENITDWVLERYQSTYGKSTTKKDIFYYIYGLLHSEDYRERFKNNLRRELPRIPFVKSTEDFYLFSDAGRKLADLHLNYEKVEPWPLEEQMSSDFGDEFETYRIDRIRYGRTQDRKNDKTVLIYNDYISLRGIPLKAYDYVVNGRSP